MRVKSIPMYVCLRVKRELQQYGYELIQIMGNNNGKSFIEL